MNAPALMKLAKRDFGVGTSRFDDTLGLPQTMCAIDFIDAPVDGYEDDILKYGAVWISVTTCSALRVVRSQATS